METIRTKACPNPPCEDTGKAKVVDRRSYRNTELLFNETIHRGKSGHCRRFLTELSCCWRPE